MDEVLQEGIVDSQSSVIGKWVKGLLVAFALLLIGLVVSGVLVAVLGALQQKALRDANQRLLDDVGLAMSAYRHHYGHLPVSLGDLTSNPAGIAFIAWSHGTGVDIWGNPLVLLPYDPSTGTATLRSLGEDGKVGGSGLAADMDVWVTGP